MFNSQLHSQNDRSFLQTRQGCVLADKISVYTVDSTLYRLYFLSFDFKEFSERGVDDFLSLFCVYCEKLSNDKDL